MAEQHTIEKILNHHLAQNQGQKITPHLIMGLMTLIAHDCRQAGLLVPPAPVADTTQPSQVVQDLNVKPPVQDDPQ